MNEISDKAEALADDAGELLDSTVKTAAKRYHEAREALDTVLQRGRSVCRVARRRAAKDTRLIDGTIHDHIYQSIAIGLGVGLIVGYFLRRPRD